MASRVGRGDTDVVLEASGVWKLFGPGADRLNRRSRLEDVDLSTVMVGVRAATIEVRKGESFVLMGLSGSGKSTLLRCLTGLTSATFGRITLAGVDLAEASARTLRDLRRSRISMVFQNYALLPHMTAEENVAFPLRVQGIGRQARLARARRMLDLVGLQGRDQSYPRQLSGGQQQRVGIARSLITDPEIWFLDEPFSALDPLIRRDMQAEMIRLKATLNKTTVFVTHDIEEAVRLADRIAIMREGKIVQIGTAQDLVLSPADDYVRAFTAGLPRQHVVTLGAIMEPLLAPLDRPPLLASDKIETGLRQIIASDAPVPVALADGNICGQVSRQRLAAFLS